jgi:hypothetical protein
MTEYFAGKAPSDKNLKQEPEDEEELDLDALLSSVRYDPLVR